MFRQYIYGKTYASNASRIILIDEDELEQKFHYTKEFAEKGFRIIHYEDDLHFRVEWEEQFKHSQDKFLILAKPSDYIPYDIRKICDRYLRVSIDSLFPKLQADCIREKPDMNYDLLCMAYENLYEDESTYQKTNNFINHVVYGKADIIQYVRRLKAELQTLVRSAKSYRDWIYIAEKKAEFDVFCAKYKIEMDVEFTQSRFLQFILAQFGKMSGQLSHDTPILVRGAMEYMHGNSEKFIIIVMDGMSEFDWCILSRSFRGIRYEQSAVYAMIPTITSISRQSLVGGKYPRQLLKPWSTSKESQEFKNCALNFGFKEEQIEYHRGYDAEFCTRIRCGCVIINDIDNIVHGQQQGRYGMYHDVEFLASTRKLSMLVQRLLARGFDVYISADHGNTPCIGQGRLTRLGVEVETKSQRMLVLEKFADKDRMLQQYNLFEYPKYFLDKKYDYLLCDIGKSFDIKGKNVMTHGGITLDEVIVPFIKIKAEDNQK